MAKKTWMFAGKSYREGHLYHLRDLPPQTRIDAKIQPEDLKRAQYRFMILSQEDLMEMLKGSYGPTLAEVVEEPYVKKLEADIRRNGLKNPPVGGEGMHRLLALSRIGKGAPYFDIEYPE